MFDNKDMIVLANLRQNARERLTKLSRQTSIPVTTLYNRIKYFDSSVVTKHTTLLNFAKLGFNTRAMVIMRVKKDMRDKAREFLESHKSVNNFYRINNGFDFMVEVIFREVKDVELFVELIEDHIGVERSAVHYVIDDIKRENFLSSPEYLKVIA